MSNVPIIGAVNNILRTMPPQELVEICRAVHTAASMTMEMATVLGIPDSAVDAFVERYYADANATPHIVLGDRIGIYWRLVEYGDKIEQLAFVVNMLAPHVGFIIGAAQSFRAHVQSQETAMINKFGSH